MLYHQIHLTSFIFSSILRAVAEICDLGSGEKLHGRIIKSKCDSDPVVKTSLLSMYGKTASFNEARKVFEELPFRDAVSWSSIISIYVQNGVFDEGLNIFRKMVFEGTRADSVTMISAAAACGELGCSRLARSVHGYIVRNEINNHNSLKNSLIIMYTKCADLLCAERLFENVDHHSITTWTAMMFCYNQTTCYQQALNVFVEMQKSTLQPNSITMMEVLLSCSNLGCLKEGKSVHGTIIRNTLEPNFYFLGPALINFYADFGRLRDCKTVFSIIQEKSLIVWNSLIAVYAYKGISNEALMLFVKMQSQGLMPDSFTLVSSLSACGNIRFIHLGSQIHSHIVKTGISHEFVHNSLIDMYSKSGFMNSAYELFKSIPSRSVVTWNTMIRGFSDNGYSVEAINFFDHMYLKSLEMDRVTFLGAIQACSSLGFIERAKWIHNKLVTYGLEKNFYIDTALCDMYAKCGDLQMARTVFDSMSERSVVSCSAMIAGYGFHGEINDAVFLFSQMVDMGIKPNDVTFMNILSACSHGGYVETGLAYFNSMINDFGIEPKPEHFSCMVDLLSRAGDLNSAYHIIKSMPVPADSSIWRALLNGCRIHKRMDMINRIKELFEHPVF